MTGLLTEQSLYWGKLPKARAVPEIGHVFVTTVITLLNEWRELFDIVLTPAR
jgi:hypothetical protein